MVARGVRGPRWRSASVLGPTLAAALAAALLPGFGFVSGRLGAARLPVGLRRGAVDSTSPAPAVSEKKEKLWSLHITHSDHYIWDDKNTFVGIVTDAGEWTLNLTMVRSAFDEAREKGNAQLLTAPLYVVKDYIKELKNYGLKAEARQAIDGSKENGYTRRDWKELPPELKDELGESRAKKAAENTGVTMSVKVRRNNHKVFGGGKFAMMKFRAYMEMASDAAGRFAPEDGLLNQRYAKILGSEGEAAVLTGLSPEEAERAVARLRGSGFDTSLVGEEKNEDMDEED